MISGDETAWPLLPSERNWSGWQILVALTTAGAATWCYIIGEYVGYYLNFRQGLAAFFAGSMLGTLIVAIALVPTCIRFGLDSIAACKPQFGTSGWALPAALQFLSIVGWNCVLLVFFGKSFAQFLVAIHVVDATGTTYIVPAATVLAGLLIFVILLRGSVGVDRISKILVWHVAAGIWMLFLILKLHWHELWAAVPSTPAPDASWNTSTGIEVGISTTLSWWPYVGAMIRMAPRGRTVALPVMLGLGVAVAMLCVIGLAGILTLKSSDPSQWLRTIGGPVYAVISLLFVTAANLGTSMTGSYCAAIGLRNSPLLQSIRWQWVLLLSIAPVVLIGVAWPDLVSANFGTFIAFIGVMFSPLCGIQIADYFVFRRRRVDIRAIFDRSAANPYRYWRGVNPAAFVAMAAGACTYIFLFNPVSYQSHFPYQYTTASIPTLVVTGLVYLIVMRVTGAQRQA